MRETATITPGDPPQPFAGNARFQPLELIGQGGMGVVFRAFDAELGRDVALKTLPDPSSFDVVLLKEEFRVLAELSHPNLIELYELFVESGTAYFTMELLDGHDIVTHARRAAGDTRSCGWNATTTAITAQLVRAVRSLHQAGILHRDIKPSNIRVTSHNRVVLLDFGLARAIASSARNDDETSGTPEYMAPEQLWGHPLSTATDWYAVGEVLYEILTGAPAFAGSLADVVDAKTKRNLVRPSQRVDDLPPRLERLVMSLLDPVPTHRAEEAEIVLALLREGVTGLEGLSPSTTSVREITFVNREDELRRFHAVTGIRRNRTCVIRVEGPSGIGKTELVARFVAELEAQGTLVLTGRCHPQESVPYTAFDGAVDMLAQHLRHERLSVELTAERRDALRRLFRAFGAVESLSAPESAASAVEPHELRRRALEGLADLFTQVAGRRPTVLWVDDMQWGDADSLLLLRELILGVSAPLTLLISCRDEPREQSPFLRELDRTLRDLADHVLDTIAVAPLDNEPARQLAAKLLDVCDSTANELSAAIAAESDGSPFFIAELARYAARHRTTPEGAQGQLINLLADRVSRLSAPERALLEIVSVAGAPLERSLALTAAGLGEPGRREVIRLSRARLLRVSSVEGQPWVEIYHDKIRQVLLSSLAEDRARACHRALADAMITFEDREPDRLLKHLLGAGDRAAAAGYAVPAAERAEAAFAFDRAAALYGQALELGGSVLPATTILERRGTALAAAGRGFEAASSFREAAESLPITSHESVDLQRRAAEQFLRSGHVDEGMVMMRSVLRRVGVTMPETPARAIAEMVFFRVRALLGGTAIAARRGDAPPEALSRLDALWSASTSLSMMNHTLADALGVRHLAEAVQLGEPSRALRAFGYEASFEAAIGGRLLTWRSAHLLRRVVKLAHETGDPFDLGWSHMATGTAAWLRAKWRATVRHCDLACSIYRTQCRGVAWELAVAQLYALSALSQLGELNELRERVTKLLRDAIDRDDLFAANNYRLGQINVVWLAQDAVDEAVALSEEAAGSWRATHYHTQRYYYAVARTHAELYAGDAWSAFRRISDEWPQLKAAKFLQLECPRVELHHLRGRAALAAAMHAPHSGTDWTRERLIALALASAKIVSRHGLPNAKPFAALLRAGAARVTGDLAACHKHLVEASASAEAADMQLYAAAAKVALGHLDGGEAARERSMASLAWMAEQRIKSPSRMLDLLAPGCVERHGG